MHTDDGGESWQVVNENTLKTWGIEFVSETTVYGNSGTEFYKSTDGGVAWQYLEETTNASYNFIADFKLKNENDGYLLSFNNLFLKSEDGFTTVETSLLPQNLFAFYKYLQLVDDTIYVAGSTLSNNFLFISTDNGDTWTQHTVGDQSSGFVLNFQAINNHLIVTTIYDIFVSEDNGVTWDVVDKLC